MDRLLIYSLEHLRLIRLIWQDAEGRLCQGNVQVTGLTGDTVTFQVMRPRCTLTLNRADILAADFKKGDEGNG